VNDDVAGPDRWTKVERVRHRPPPYCVVVTSPTGASRAARGCPRSLTTRARRCVAAVVTRCGREWRHRVGRRPSMRRVPPFRPLGGTRSAWLDASTATRWAARLGAPPARLRPASGCNPNYSGACVPSASDVDCLRVDAPAAVGGGRADGAGLGSRRSPSPCRACLTVVRDSVK
jgi:hypothetical protein